MPENKINVPDQSAIKKSGFSGFMSRLYGWMRGSGSKKIDFVNVDIGSNQKISQSMVNDFDIKPNKFSEQLDDLFNRWLNDNTDKITELQERKARIDQLSYMTLNDPYVNRTVALYADEATQLDSQDTILQIETPDPLMTRDMYDLLNKWGITQNRIRSTIEQMAEYGDAFWANTITEKGVQSIHPLQQYQVNDRLEFNPVKVLEQKKRREGFLSQLSNNNFLIAKMIDNMENIGDFAEMFNTKLFGFVVDDLAVPPWCITHFRVNADGSQFAPWGESPILGAIAPFKQTQSTIALQSLARMMNFPITLFKVKTSDSMDEARQFGVVNRVREAFDNIGVNPKMGSSEVYTNNTRIWLPDGLVTVEVVKADSANSDSVDDISLYQSREAVSLGLPKSFFGEDGWYSTGDSGKALTRQYKPFARKVYTLQSAFIDGLSDLFRIHFAITGIYDFRTPFTISMKYPSVEETDDRVNAQKSSIEIADTVIGMIKSAIGASEDEPLPPDIIRDILGTYTFLKPSDIMKWTRDAKFYRIPKNDESSDEEGGIDFDSDSEDNFDLDNSNDLGDLGGSDSMEEGPSDTDMSVEESVKNKNVRLRERQLCEKFKEQKNKIYFDVLKENSISGFVRAERHVHVSYSESESLDLMLKTLSEERVNNNSRLHEGFVKRNSRKKK